MAAGVEPYATVAARDWLQGQGIEFNQMGLLEKEFREIYERHYDLPVYDDAPQHPSKR